MKHPLVRGRVLACVVVGMAGAFGFADDRSAGVGESSDERIKRLESLLETQQQRIQTLEQQAATASSQDQDAARTEIMKKQIREILGEQSFRESLIPSTAMAGYENGFFIKSSDDLFSLRINSQFQFRWTHYATRSTNRWLQPGLQRNDRTGFDAQRVRLRFSGNAWSKDLTYVIELDASPGTSYNARLLEGNVNYRFADELQFKAGVFKAAGTRAYMMPTWTHQMVDQSVVDAVFNYGYTMGVRFWGRMFDKRLDYMFDVLNSLGSYTNRTITPDAATTPFNSELDGNPAILFKTVWHALGDKPGKEFEFPQDIEYHESPALDLGFRYGFNDDQGDLGTLTIPYPAPRFARLGRGGFGATNTWGLQINDFGFESAFKWRGLSLTGEYILRMVDPRRAGRTPFTNWWLLTGDDSTTVQHGAYVQAGYFLPIPGMEKKLEIAARVGGISALAEHQEGTWEYAAGLNYYFEGNRVKLQTDVVKVSEVPVSSNANSLANVNDDALIFRMQLQVGF